MIKNEWEKQVLFPYPDVPEVQDEKTIGVIVGRFMRTAALSFVGSTSILAPIPSA